jgi:spore germination protein KA
MCGKINEGRVGIIVDGTPVAIFVPYLFVENFQNIDDYAVGPYYAFFTRFLKFLAFFISIYAPALYVAIGSFHQAVLPSELLTSLAKAEEATPFPLFFEALMMQIIYELIREAGLRLPKQFGFAITIVGALIVGEAAVTADLIGAPMVIVVAITATTSLVVPTLYETGTVLRFLFIFLAAMSGLYGMTMAMAFIILHVCSIKSYEVPYTSPLLPFDAFSQRDVLIRAPWKILSRKRKKVQDMAGSNVDKTWG